MIKRIGLQRVLLLAVLFSMNLLVVCSYYFAVLPAEFQAQATLNATNGQISDISTKLQGIKSEMATFNNNYERYQALEKGGFFSNQDRFAAARVLDSIREKANLLGFGYNIDEVTPVVNADAAAANVDLIKSQIKIDQIGSVIDSNIYKLVEYLNTQFPQHARVERFEIKRTMPVTEANLKKFVQDKTGFITASVIMNWYTVVPKVDESALSPAAGAAGSGFRGR